MVKKPDTCKGCPLYRLGIGFVKLELPPKFDNVKLLIQGEAPGNNEVDEGRAFIGKAGHWLRHNILNNAGIDSDEVLYDNTLRCLPPVNKAGEHYPTGNMRITAEKCCRQYDLWDKVPTNIPLMLTGGKALKQVLGWESISEWHGHITIKDGRLVGTTYHPSAVMRQPNLLPLVIREVSNLLNATQEGILNRPAVHRHTYLPPSRNPRVIDLEWDDSAVKVVGMAESGDSATSTFKVDEAAEAVRKHQGTLIGHNVIEADLPKLGITPPNWKPETVFDTMIAAHLVHAHFAELGLLDLGSMVRYYFPIANWKHDTGDILRYNGLDCAYNYRLYEALKEDLEATEQTHLMEKQQKLAEMARQMRLRGVRLNVDDLADFYNHQMSTREQVRQGFPINPNSPRQVLAWLASEFGLRLPNIRYETLVKYRGRHPLLDLLIEYREDSKSLKTWFPIHTNKDRTLEHIDEYAHPKFNVTGTAVARFSSSEPNFQNLPPHLRRFIIPFHDDEQIVSFDFSQIENRCIAWLAEDEKMLGDFASGMDFHTLSASRIFGKRYEDVTPQERYEGKKTIHATNYGETAYHLSERLFGNRKSDSVQKAKWLQEAYFNAYPAIRDWQERIREQLDSGNVGLRNPFGRLRMVYAQSSHERMKRGCHYMGCSTAAEIVNQRALEVLEQVGLLPILIVHDELVYSLPKGDERLRKQILDILQSPIKEMNGFVIPVNSKVGNNYGNLQ